jgi:hypothetical protein
MVAPNEALCGPSSAALNVGFTWAFAGTIANGDYVVVMKAPYAFRLTETTCRSDSGTATATVKIDGTGVGGSAHSVSSTEETIARSSSNTVARDQDVTITIASSSSCVNPRMTFKGQRL